jgi:hypothetical protein
MVNFKQTTEDAELWVPHILFSIIIIEAYLVKGGKFSNTHLLSGCIREECGTQSSASSVVCLKFTIPILFVSNIR